MMRPEYQEMWTCEWTIRKLYQWSELCGKHITAFVANHIIYNYHNYNKFICNYFWSAMTTDPPVTSFAMRRAKSLASDLHRIQGHSCVTQRTHTRVTTRKHSSKLQVVNGLLNSLHSIMTELDKELNVGHDEVRHVHASRVVQAKVVWRDVSRKLD